VQRSVVSGIERQIAQIGVVARQPYGTASELEAALRALYAGLHDPDVVPADRAELTRAAPYLLHTLFKARIDLRDRIAAWRESGLLGSRTAEAALRDVLRLARYASDVLGEVAASNPRLGPDQRTRRGFTGSANNTLVNPAFYDGRNIPFRSGDVLLMRGSAHNSAAIARIGDVDTQFSHTAIIYIDPKGEHWVVEALIEDGAVINRLTHVLDHGLGRAVLYRFKDAEVAAKAASLAYERVLATKTGQAPHIPYDFTMRLTGRKSLFCAKLVSQAFADATDGAVALPAFKTRLDQKTNREFFKSIGVKAKETYAPGDIDLDPRFDVVAEWQDYRLTPVLRRQDMVMTKFFEWMETRGYRFREDFFITLIAIFGRLSSYLSDRAKNLISAVVPKVPRNMSRSCVAAIVMLHKSAEELTPALEALEDDHIKRTGLPLHPAEILSHLERLRETSGGRIGYLRGKP
jgi:hypothetical protein